MVKNWISMIFIISIILLSGCQVNSEGQLSKSSEMAPDELPDVRAFEDEFTREFFNQRKKQDLDIIRFFLGLGNMRWTFLRVEKWGTEAML